MVRVLCPMWAKLLCSLNRNFTELFEKFLKKAVKKAVSDNNVDAPEMEPVVPDAEAADESKRALWRFILQTLISILTAILTALGAASCVSHL